MDDQLNDVFEACGQQLDEVMDQYEHHRKMASHVHLTIFCF